MKILITTPIFPPEIGGPATYTLEVSRRLQARGHTVRIITFADSSPEVSDLEIASVRTSYPVLGSIIRQSRFFMTVLGAARDVNMIYAQDPLVVGPSSLIAARFTRKPIIVRFGGDFVWQYAYNNGRTSKPMEDFLQKPEGGPYIQLIMRIQKFVFRHVDKVITPSHHLKTILMNYYGVAAGRIEVVYNAIELVQAKAGGGKPGYPTLITIGRLVPLKRIDELIKLVPALVEKYPDLKLVVVGDGPEDKNLKKLCQEAGIEQNVIFTGYVTHERILELLKASDLFILNSLYEGLPNTVLEAMACRCPVLATDIGGTSETIEDGTTGLLVNVRKGEELKQKIISLLESTELRAKIVENAYWSIGEKFTWERNLSILERELEEAIRSE